MQDNNRYLNLLRTTELCKRKGEPYVPYDGYELDMFTKFAALEHLPKLDEANNVPEGWTLHASLPTEDFQSLVDNVKIYAKDPSKNEFGVMVDTDRKSFLVFIKQSF